MKFIYTLFACFATIALQVHGAEADLEKARGYLEKAGTLMKEDHRGNAPKTIGLLKAAQKIFLSKGELTEEEETELSKINSHIYWQSKFSSTKSIAPGQMPTPTIDNDDDADDKTTAQRTDKAIGFVEVDEDIAEKDAQKWENSKTQKAEAFDNHLDQAKNYEKQHGGDTMSNMLNYLDLQVKVVDLQQARDLMEKTKEYNNKLQKDYQDAIQEVLSGLKHHDELLNNKKYKKIYAYIGKNFKSFKPKHRGPAKMLAMEMKAMADLKDDLINLPKTDVVPLPRIPGRPDGVAISITERGIGIKLEDGDRSFISWNAVSEHTLLGMAEHIMEGGQDEDLFLLGLSNLRLENFEKAFQYFHQLIERSSENYLNYKDYLALSETGYRLKFGPRFETIFQEANQLASQGHHRQALDKLVQFKEDYLDTLLGRSYIERFKIIYNDISKNS